MLCQHVHDNVIPYMDEHKGVVLLLIDLSPVFDVVDHDVPTPMFYFFHLMLHSYDYNVYVEDLLPANLCLVTLLRSEQCSQFKRFCLQHRSNGKQIQFQNKRDWQ